MLVQRDDCKASREKVSPKYSEIHRVNNYRRYLHNTVTPVSRPTSFLCFFVYLFSDAIPSVFSFAAELDVLTNAARLESRVFENRKKSGRTYHAYRTSSVLYFVRSRNHFSGPHEPIGRIRVVFNVTGGARRCRDFVEFYAFTIT